jgi:acyl-CoA synthetase (AMP-forming)/AMP-acid ligase II
MTRARAEAITLGDLLVLAAERFGDRVAVDDGSSPSTCSELCAAAAATAGALIDAGVPRHARVGVRLTEEAQRSATLLGIALAGTVAVPLSAEEDLASTAAELQLRALVTDTATVPPPAELPVIELASRLAGATDADRLGEPELQMRRLGTRLRDPAVIAAVDGAGSARAVLTHEALVRTWRAWALMSGMGPGQRLWCSEPPSQLAGVGPLIACLSSGATWVQSPSAATIGLIVASSTPNAGDAPDRLLRAYGPVEAGGLACASIDARPTPGDDHDPWLCGPPLPGVLVRIADDDEILVRGYNLADGYLGDAAGPRSLQGGWLHTGDRGRLDERGRLRLARD